MFLSLFETLQLSLVSNDTYTLQGAPSGANIRKTDFSKAQAKDELGGYLN